MSTITSANLKRLVPLLDDKEFTVFLCTVLGLKTQQQQEAVSVLDQLKTGIWEFLKALGFVTDMQRREILHRLSPYLAEMVPMYLATESEKPYRVFRLVIAEQRWVHWPKHPTWYDIVRDEELTDLPYPAVLLIVCDVTALYRRQQEWLATLNGAPSRQD